MQQSLSSVWTEQTKAWNIFPNSCGHHRHGVWSLLGWRVPHMRSRLEYTGDIFLAYTMNPVKIDTSLHEEELLCCAWRNHTKKRSWIVEIQVTMDVLMQPLFEFSAHSGFPARAQLVLLLCRGNRDEPHIKSDVHEWPHRSYAYAHEICIMLTAARGCRKYSSCLKILQESREMNGNMETVNMLQSPSQSWKNNIMLVRLVIIMTHKQYICSNLALYIS